MINIIESGKSIKRQSMPNEDEDKETRKNLKLLHTYLLNVNEIEI